MSIPTPKRAPAHASTTPAPTASEFVDVVQHFARLRGRFKVVLPEDLARLRALLDENHPAGPGGRVELKGDYSLLFSVGSILSHQQQVTMGELSTMLEVPLSTATRIVDWLVTSNIAARIPDPHDRRVVRVSLTETGQTLFRLHGEFMRRRMEKILQHFTPAERHTLLGLMQKLAEALENETAS